MNSNSSQSSTTLAIDRSVWKSFLNPPVFINPKTISGDHLDDFTDVFGPLPDIQIPTTNDPAEIIYNSHSLVGPSPNCVKTNHDHDHDVKEFDQQLITASDHSVNPTIGLEDFQFLKLVGKGAFGKVFQVKKKDTNEIYAMKVMRKDRIMKNDYIECIKAERDILTKIQHPFIVQLRYSFQTKYKLYLVLDFMNGGHLFFQLYHQGLFREDLARVYAAEIVSAVCHLHANGIMHRDLKPENILLDADGHAMVTDFGVAKEFDEINTRSDTFCGTAEYMPPEIIIGKDHDKGADWWSFGILLFEMLSGMVPFYAKNGENIQKKIVKEKAKLPAFLSKEAHSILKGLLQKDPSKRLGNGVKGSEEVKSHKWFKGINWKKLEAREIEPSFKPKVAGIHCIANFDKKLTDMALLDSPASSPKITNLKNPFKGFTFHRPAHASEQDHIS